MPAKPPMCNAESRRFDTGAKRGLGRVWYNACSNRASHDPGADGVPTKCYAHSAAAAEKKRERRDAQYEKVLADLDKMKAKFAAREAKRASRRKNT